MNKKLVKVILAFDLMDKDEIFEADVETPRMKSLIKSGYIALLHDVDELFLAQPESEIESTSKVGGSAPRSKARGKSSAESK